MTNNFFTDLLAVQAEIEPIEKDSKNPFYNSDYTSLNATIFACKEVLNKHNFILLQPLQSDADGVYVCTTLLHTSGEKIESKTRIMAKALNDPQAQGSAITYARRYSLKSILAMFDADDDAEQAMKREIPEEISEYKCAIHGEVMERRFSEAKQKSYWVHFDENGNGCFGQGYRPKSKQSK